jgi:RND family efflux transporter MFP subunit
MLRPFLLSVVLPVFLLAGCSDDSAPPVVPPKPVKLETVGGDVSAGAESFVATLRARQRSELGFETGGRIADIAVEVGDHVRAGQLLARLEEGPMRWRVDKAEADRAAAQAALAERTTQLRQHEALARDQIVSPTTLESVQTQYRVAQSQLQAADAALAQASRELTLARIVAPFDGEIVARTAQPHVDVGPGQVILGIEAGKTLEVVAMLPETVAARLMPGLTASVSIDGRAPASLSAKLDKLSARNESGSLVQAIFRLEGDVSGLRSGAVLSLELPRATGGDVSLPVTALMPAEAPGQGAVFVLDTVSGQLQRRPVTYGEKVLPGGRLAIVSGLHAGDQVVVAGTSFLTEGQRVVKHDAQTVLNGDRP